MKLKAVLVEDEAQSREILRNYLDKYCTDVEVLGEASTVQEGLEQIKITKPELVFPKEILR